MSMYAQDVQIAEPSDYYTSAAGITISKERAEQEIRAHHLDPAEFFWEYGAFSEYDAQDVLAWLGY
jgi:hypothetical protein